MWATTPTFLTCVIVQDLDSYQKAKINHLSLSSQDDTVQLEVFDDDTMVIYLMDMI